MLWSWIALGAWAVLVGWAIRSQIRYEQDQEHPGVKALRERKERDGWTA